MPKPLPPIESLLELEAADITPPEPIIDHLLERGSKMMLVSCAKGNKTWCLMDMAFCISQGLPDWWGMPCHQHKVLYINFELHRWFFRERIREISRAHGLATVTNPSMDVWNLRGCARAYMELCFQIKERFREGHPYALIVIDPYYKFNSSGKVENAAEDVAAVLNAMEELGDTLGCAIAYAHHTPKGDVSERSVVDRGSGSGVFGRDPDVIVAVAQSKDAEDEFVAEFKFRNHSPRPPLGLRYTFPVMRPDESVIVSRGRPEAHKRDVLLALLPASGYRDRDWQQAAEEKLGMSRSTYHRKKQQLHVAELVECSDGVWIPMIPGIVGESLQSQPNSTSETSRETSETPLT